MMRFRLFHWVSIFVVVAFATMAVPSVHAKDKPPPVYESGKLIDIQETEQTNTSYRTTRQKDGTTFTEPIHDDQKIYHISVQVGDIIYVGRYAPTFSFSKAPGWIIGDPISVRFDKNKMILQKPGGKELKTKIEKRYRAKEAQAGSN